METEVLPEMTIDIPGVFDTLTSEAGANVQSLNLGTVWNELRCIQSLSESMYV